MVIIDSDIIIDYFRELDKAIDFINRIMTDNVFITSITKMEILVGARNNNEIVEIDKFLSEFKLIYLNKSVSQHAIKFIKQYSLQGNLRIPDALIAACVKYCNCLFYTNNIKHFKMIKEINVKRVY